MRDDRDRLLDILEAIEKIEERTMGDKDLFERDEMIQVWVLYHVQIIGEAAARLSQALRARSDHIPWSDIMAMRNVLVHHYFGIDLDQIWDAVTTDLPALKVWTTQLLEEAENQ